METLRRDVEELTAASFETVERGTVEGNEGMITGTCTTCPMMTRLNTCRTP